MNDQQDFNSEIGTESNFSDSNLFNSDDSVDDNTSRQRCPRFNATQDIHNPVFSVGMILKSAKEVKRAVINLGIRWRRDVRFEKNELKRVRAGELHLACLVTTRKALRQRLPLPPLASVT